MTDEDVEMTQENVSSKRRLLTIATAGFGLAGATGLAVPFAGSLLPSERAKAAGAPVEVDISKLEPGQQVTVEWRGKPVWIIQRTPEALEQLPGPTLAPGAGGGHRNIQLGRHLPQRLARQGAAAL